jgi:hypothetical protein
MLNVPHTHTHILPKKHTHIIYSNLFINSNLSLVKNFQLILRNKAKTTTCITGKYEFGKLNPSWKKGYRKGEEEKVQRVMKGLNKKE